MSPKNLPNLGNSRPMSPASSIGFSSPTDGNDDYSDEKIVQDLCLADIDDEEGENEDSTTDASEVEDDDDDYNVEVVKVYKDDDDNEYGEAMETQKPSALDVLYYAKMGKILDRSVTPVVDISSLSSGMFPSIAANVYYSGVLANGDDDDEDGDQDVALSTTSAKRSTKKSERKKVKSTNKVVSLKKLVSEALHTSKAQTEEKALDDGIGESSKIKTKLFKGKITKKMQPSQILAQNQKEVENADQFTITSIKQTQDHHLHHDNHSVASSVTMPCELFASSIHNTPVEKSKNARERAQNEVCVFETITKVGNKTYRVRTDDTSTIVTEIADDSKEAIVDCPNPSLHSSVESHASCMDHKIDKSACDSIAKQPRKDIFDSAASSKNGKFNEESSSSNHMTATETTQLATINGTLTPTFMPSMLAAANTDGNSNCSEMRAIKKAASFEGPVASFKSKVRAMSPTFGSSERDAKADTANANEMFTRTKAVGDNAPATSKNDASNNDDDPTNDVTDDSTRSFYESNKVHTEDGSSVPTSFPAPGFEAHSFDKRSSEEAKSIKKAGSFTSSVSSFKSKVRALNPVVGSSQRVKPPLMRRNSKSEPNKKAAVKESNGNRSIPAAMSMTDVPSISGKEKSMPVRTVRSMSPALGRSDRSMSKTAADKEVGVNKAHDVIKTSSFFNIPSSSNYNSIISCRSMSPGFGGINTGKSMNETNGMSRRLSIPGLKKKSKACHNSQNQNVEEEVTAKDCIGSVVSKEAVIMRNDVTNETKGVLPPRAPVTNPNSSKVKKRDDGSQAGPLFPEAAEVIDESGSIKSGATGGKSASERAATTKIESDDKDAPLELEQKEVNISDTEARDVYNSLMISKSSGSSKEDEMNDEVVEVVANVVSTSIDVADSFGVSETDSRSQMSLKHIVTVPVTLVKNTAPERLPSLVEADGSLKHSDDDSLNEILSDPKKEVNTYSSHLTQIKKATPKGVYKKEAVIKCEPTDNVPSNAPVEQIDVNKGDMESVSLLPEIKGLESRKIWDEYVALTPGGEDSVPANGLMGFVCGGKDFPVEIDEDESIIYSDTDAKPIQNNTRTYSCFDVEEMQREISEEIKGSLKDIKASVNSSLRNFVSLFDITSDGGLEVVAAECSGARNNSKNGRLNAPRSNIENEPKCSSLNRLNHTDTYRKTITIAEKQAQHQRKLEEVAIQKKRKYLAKLRAVSMKHMQ